MLNKILIKNAKIVNENKIFLGSVLMVNDKIEEIVQGKNALTVNPPQQIIDAEGCYLLPGIIDEHVHFREPGMTQKADIYTESRAAAAGGVTTFLDMPNTKPATTSIPAFYEKLDLAAEKSCVNYGFFFGATDSNSGLLRQLNPRRIAGIKLFMGASTGNMLVDQDYALRQIFSESPVIVMTHCESTPIISERMQLYQEKYGSDPDIKYHPVIRSEEACVQSTLLAIKLAEEYHTRLHVAHITTAVELDYFSDDNSQITAEACLPHLLFSDKDYKQLGARIKCNPAIKTLQDRMALLNGLTNGKIKTVGTDHAPHQISDKRGGAYKAASGMPMIQFSLVAMLELVNQGFIGLTDLTRLMCHNPADTFQIENRGYIREGYKADLVLVRPNTPWTLSPNMIFSKCNWSPVEGRTFHWKVEKTFCNGFLIYNGRTITNDNYRGLPVTYAR